MNRRHISAFAILPLAFLIGCATPQRDKSLVGEWIPLGLSATEISDQSKKIRGQVQSQKVRLADARSAWPSTYGFILDEDGGGRRIEWSPKHGWPENGPAIRWRTEGAFIFIALLDEEGNGTEQKCEIVHNSPSQFTVNPNVFGGNGVYVRHR